VNTFPRKTYRSIYKIKSYWQWDTHIHIWDRVRIIIMIVRVRPRLIFLWWLGVDLYKLPSLIKELSLIYTVECVPKWQRHQYLACVDHISIEDVTYGIFRYRAKLSGGEFQTHGLWIFEMLRIRVFQSAPSFQVARHAKCNCRLRARRVGGTHENQQAVDTYCYSRAGVVAGITWPTTCSYWCWYDMIMVRAWPFTSRPLSL